MEGRVERRKKTKRTGARQGWPESKRAYKRSMRDRKRKEKGSQTRDSEIMRQRHRDMNEIEGTREIDDEKICRKKGKRETEEWDKGREQEHQVH